MLGRFPYFVAYRLLPGVIRILAIMHERQDSAARLPTSALSE